MFKVLKKQEDNCEITNKKSSDESLTLSLHRTEALYDGILAIAMTLLVLDIEIPNHDRITTSGEFLLALGNMHLTFIKYFTSFFILASLWIANNKEIHYLNKTNKTHMWLNLLCLFLLLPGLSFEYGFFSKKNKHSGNTAILIPGGILITVSILFYINIFFGWELMKLLWPVFILAPAIGLFQFYLFGSRNKGILLPVGILTGIGVFSLIITMLHINFFVYIFSVILITVGVYFIFKGMKRTE